MVDDPAVTVAEQPDGSFTVEVRQGAAVTRHRVTVPEGLGSRLGHPEVAAGDLVRESFTFLLEREPASSILSSFGLEVIARYFPEYEAVVAGRLSQEP